MLPEIRNLTERRMQNWMGEMKDHFISISLKGKDTGLVHRKLFNVVRKTRFERVISSRSAAKHRQARLEFKSLYKAHI